ncbi:MAG TPA: hypothetical protein VD908_02065 [Cytophagales bacterium]|nr:hypothetical protein [Cytophagales bacterium]
MLRQSDQIKKLMGSFYGFQSLSIFKVPAWVFSASTTGNVRVNIRETLREVCVNLPGVTTYISRRTQKNQFIVLLANAENLDISDIEKDIAKILKDSQ